jgi:hypothetical protein
MALLPALARPYFGLAGIAQTDQSLAAPNRADQCILSGAKKTSVEPREMSAYDPNRTSFAARWRMQRTTQSSIQNVIFFLCQT